jgi:RimJ/RimL family protein N-acetyltransferase
MHRPVHGKARLEPMVPAHAEAFADMIFEAGLWRHARRVVATAEDLERYVDDALADRRAQQAYPFTIIDAASDQVAGSVRLWRFDWPNDAVQVGEGWLGRGFRGTGLALDALRAVVGFAFETLAMERVAFRRDARNEAAGRLLDRFGATAEGVLRADVRNADGYRRDTAVHGVLRPEWAALARRAASAAPPAPQA